MYLLPLHWNSAPYRRPQIGKVIVKVFVGQEPFFVLGRAVIVAAPAGFIIWILANVTAGDATLLSHCAAFRPIWKSSWLGWNHFICFYFGISGEQELSLPIMIMTYMALGTLTEIDDLMALRKIISGK